MCRIGEEVGKAPPEKPSRIPANTGEKADIYHTLVFLLLEFKSLPPACSSFFFN